MGNTPKIKTRKNTRKPAPASQPGGAPRWLRQLGVGVGIAAVLAFAAFMALGGSPIADGIPDGTRQVEVTGAQHVEGEIHADDGETPAGGDHNAVWLNCGVYDDVVDSEFAVHSLEHGAVWITYSPALDTAGVETVRDVAESRQKVIVSPEPNQDPAVRATAWGFQLDLDDPGDGRLRQFINEFEGSSTAPEPGGLCSGGAGNPQT